VVAGRQGVRDLDRLPHNAAAVGSKTELKYLVAVQLDLASLVGG